VAQTDIVIIDASAGAFDLQGLDDNSRRDAEMFARTMIEPFRVREVATIVLDHVVKSGDARGRFAIGSERKVGGADVHLGFDTVVPFGRGRTGLIRVSTHKDRFGYLSRPRAAELELHSDPDTNAVTWQFKEADQSGDPFRPTTLMQRVSRYLEGRVGAASRNEIESGVTGKRDGIRAAVNALIADGYAAESTGTRGARLVELLKPYTSPDLAPTSPRRSDATSPLAPPSIDGGEGEVATAASGEKPRKTSNGHQRIALSHAQHIRRYSTGGLS
jgi:hypothetical protein